MLITSGNDADTVSAIKYWSEMGITISCAPYRIYEVDQKPFIHFDTFNPDGDVQLEGNEQRFIVNTNRTYDKDAWRDMIGDGQKGKAAAWGDRKWAICNIPKNSMVYLYHTGNGIIAKGTTTDSYKTADDEHYVPIDFEWAITNCKEFEESIKAWQINAKLNSGYKFRNTVFAIPNEMADAINSIAKESEFLRTRSS